MQAGNKFCNQSGSLLLEFMLVAVISILVAVWGSNKLADQAKELQAQSLANWMVIAQNGVQSYLEQHYSDIVKNLGIAGTESYNQQLKPGWDQLRQEGFIDTAWGNIGPAKYQLDYRITSVGDCQATNCHLQALIYTTSPVVNRSGKPELSFIANWLLAVRGQGLVLRNGNVFNGAGLSVKVPAGMFQGGTLALLAEKNILKNKEPDDTGDSENDIGGSSGDYLVVQDHRNPDFQADLSVMGSISSESYLYSRGLVLDNKKSINGSCTKDGEISHNIDFPGLLVCEGGFYRLVSYPKAGGYMVNTIRGCNNILGQSTANPVTGQCSCPSGHKDVQVSESGSVTDPGGLNLGYICLFM